MASVDDQKCNVAKARYQQRWPIESAIAQHKRRLGSVISIVVIKRLPVLECTNCPEFSIEDPVMEKIENLLEQTDEAAELEVIVYAT